MRGSRAVAIEEPAERGLALRVLLYSPKDLVAGLAAFAAVCAIIANAIVLQAGRHPSPMFGSTVVLPLSNGMVANPLPRPRPADAARSGALDPRLLDGKAVEIKPAAAKSVEARPVEKAPEAKGDAMTASLRSSAATSVARPPAPIPASAPAATRGDPLGDLITSSRRIASVQRALTDFGYGQLKPTGNIGSDTLAAIKKFESDRKLPVTGQISDRLVRELTAVTGRAIN